jgi:hypothetical protein
VLWEAGFTSSVCRFVADLAFCRVVCEKGCGGDISGSPVSESSLGRWSTSPVDFELKGFADVAFGRGVDAGCSSHSSALDEMGDSAGLPLVGATCRLPS